MELARYCGARGGGLPAVFNAANEVAVDAFMGGTLEFTEIVKIVAQATAKLDSLGDSKIRDIADVSAIEQDARQVARSLVAENK